MRRRTTDREACASLPRPVTAVGLATLVAAVAIAAASLRGPGTTAEAGTLAQVPDTTSTSVPSVPSAPDRAAATPAPPGRWRLFFGGDTLLTREPADGVDPFASIDPPLADADLAIVNVETAIATVGAAAPDKQYTFRSSTRLPGLLAAAGVDVASLANNHSLDFGTDALAETIDRLRAAGVRPVGAGENRADALRPVELEVQGTRVVVLAASQVIPTISWAADDRRPGVAFVGKQELDDGTRRLTAAIGRARATHDVVIVVLHWGVEGDPCPSAPQLQIGAALRRAGATVVLGAHPHVLQPIVVDDAGGLIAYSMGNFVWDPRSGDSAETGVLEVAFEGGRVVGHRLHPHRLDRNGWASAVHDPARADTILARAARACPGAPGSASSGVA